MEIEEVVRGFYTYVYKILMDNYEKLRKYNEFCDDVKEIQQDIYIINTLEKSNFYSMLVSDLSFRIKCVSIALIRNMNIEGLKVNSEFYEYYKKIECHKFDHLRNR